MKFTPSKLALALALAMGLTSTLTEAAGLGRINVQSALGQPLRAEVEITSLNKDEESGLNAKVASQEAFKQAGMEFNPALLGVRLSIERRADGVSLIKLTSTGPVNEPFLDMLLELNWSNGRLIREYTVLLDPPELKLSRPGAITSPVVPSSQSPRSSIASPGTFTPLSVPPIKQNEIEVSNNLEPLPATGSTRKSIAQKRADARADAARKKADARALAKVDDDAAKVSKFEQSANEVEKAPTAESRYEVKRGDTLGKIARSLDTQGLSLDQTLVALYRNNENAFDGRNMNRLRAGQVLKLPAKEVVAEITKKEARQIVIAQTADFLAYREKVAAAVSAAPARSQSVDSAQATSGKITAKVKENNSANLATDKLKLSAANKNLGKDKGTGAGVAVEQSIAIKNATNEANARSQELAKNVADLKDAVKLKNEQMAKLEAQKRNEAAAKAEADAKAKAEADAKAKAEADAKPADTLNPAKAEDQPLVSPPSETTVNPVDNQQPVTVPEVVPEIKPPVVSDSPIKQEESFFGELLASPFALGGFLLIGLLGAGYTAYSIIRRKKFQQFEDSIITGTNLQANSVFGHTGGQSVDANSMFNSTFGPVTTSALDSNEVDPIAEAEVYIAYGRQAQAEEILKEALRRDTERQSVRLKLIELCAQRGDLKAVETLAGEMYAMTNGNCEEWPRVLAMGVAVDPNNAMYKNAVPKDLPIEEADHLKEEEGTNHSGSINKPSENAENFVSMVTSTASAALSNSGNVDATHSVTSNNVTEDLPDINLDVSAPAIAIDPKQDVDFDLDFNSPNLDIDVPVLDQPVDEQVTTLANSVQENNQLSSDQTDISAKEDLNFALGDIEIPSLADHASTNEDELSIDVPALQTLLEPTAESTSEAVSEFNMGSLDLELPPEPSTAADEDTPSHWQEIATKLDLAKAYLDIGDKEGAQELLEEVVDAGDAAQKAKAQAMLADIA